MKKVEEIFRENLICLLTESNITERQLANKLESSFTTINRWVNGRTTPELERLNDIANLFHVEPFELLTPNLNRNKHDSSTPVYDLTDNYICLYKKLFGENSDVPKEVIKIVNYVATIVLNDNQWNILKRYYDLNGEGKCTCDDIAKQNGITKQRVQQIIAKSENIMRNSVNDFIYAEKSINRISGKHLSPKLVDEICENVKEQLLLYTEDDVNKEEQSNISQEENNDEEDEDELTGKNKKGYNLDTYVTDIKELNSRTRNTLIRNQCLTLGDFINLTQEEIENLSGIGASSVAQIRYCQGLYKQPII